MIFFCILKYCPFGATKRNQTSWPSYIFLHVVVPWKRCLYGNDHHAHQRHQSPKLSGKKSLCEWMKCIFNDRFAPTASQSLVCISFFTSSLWFFDFQLPRNQSTTSFNEFQAVCCKFVSFVSNALSFIIFHNVSDSRSNKNSFLQLRISHSGKFFFKVKKLPDCPQ